MNLEKTAAFSRLIQSARCQLPLNPGADQVIAVETAKGITLYFANDLGAGPRDEDRFVQTLLDRNDTAVKYLVCMWSTGSIDLPSMHLRKRLVEIDPENGHTLMLLQTADSPAVRTIRWSMP